MTIQPESLKTLRSSDVLAKVHQGKRRTHSFNVDYTDINPEFTGKFTIHYPTQMERMRMGVIRSSLLNGILNVDVDTYNIAYIISTLDVVIDEKPDWFDVDNPELDYPVMEAVFKEYENWLDSFRPGAKPDSSTGTSQDNGSQISMVDTKDVSSTTNGQ